ncbi:hypothetical protein KO525_04675 [Psychrosphaera sp. B3R10]|uniref:hypothetical protein n=1 Tax=unclassified Psychrosphaera TaxID=2641570 RepID=UPI001C0854CF|nr:MULTISPECIES: hypothetical protein [unclassified Psychrosphaera]MBU2881991.1 hypothetical protein [Psychrosphaera sp. I2R16]MBU2988670.1 hypothetical protein [Psychrosphaera sp. B3R10]
MDEITSRLLDKTEFNVRQEYWLDAALLVTFLAVEKSDSPLGEKPPAGHNPRSMKAACKAKKGTAYKAN